MKGVEERCNECQLDSKCVVEKARNTFLQLLVVNVAIPKNFMFMLAL